MSFIHTAVHSNIFEIILFAVESKLIWNFFFFKWNRMFRVSKGGMQENYLFCLKNISWKWFAIHFLINTTFISWKFLPYIFTLLILDTIFSRFCAKRATIIKERVQVGLSQFFCGLRFAVKSTWAPSHTVKSTRFAHSTVKSLHFNRK